MIYRSYFGKQNSTLGSVVPLAMFFIKRGVFLAMEIDSDYRISVFSSSFGPEQSADYRVGDTFGKIYIIYLIPRFSSFLFTF